MRKVMVLAYLANVALAIASLAVLPATVASHFGPGGHPDGWMSREANAGLFVGICTFMLVVFLFTPALVLKLPPGLVNLPNRNYWLSAEQREATRAKVAGLLNEFGAAILTFFFIVQGFAMQANSAAPAQLNETPLLAALIAFLIFTALWCLKLVRAFRLPSGK